MTVLPCSELSDFIRYYVLTNLAAVETCIPATAAPILVVFHSGGTRLRDLPQGRPFPAAFLTGPSISAQHSVATAGTRLLSILFRPGQLQRFFDVNVSELSGRQIPLADIAGREADEFLDQFRATWQSSMLIQLTERFLWRQASKQEARRSRGEMLRIPGELLFRPLQTLTRAIGVGGRQFQRRFSAQYGVTLRDFRRLARFERSILGLLRGGPAAPSLSQLAQSAGYFDQAHFNHDFRAFSGYSPSRLRSLAGGPAPEAWPFRFDSHHLEELLRSEGKVASVQDI